MNEFSPQTKLLSHKSDIAAFANNLWTAPPIGVEISPTNACNARCPWCFYVSGAYKQRHSEEELDCKTLFTLISDLLVMGVESITWTGGGDPSVYTRIDDAIDEAYGLGLRQGIFTNAYRPLRSPEKLDWIRVTVTEQFKITKHVAVYAKATKTGVNFNLCEENKSQLVPMIEQARAAGVAYFQVRPALADRYDLQTITDLPPNLSDWEVPGFRIVTTDYKWQDYTRPHGYPKCHGHRIVPFVWHNGDVSTCAYHFGKDDYTLGNLQRDGGLIQIWKSERRRAMISRGVNVIPDCQHCCKLHEINKVLTVLNGDNQREIPDRHFI